MKPESRLQTLILSIVATCFLYYLFDKKIRYYLTIKLNSQISKHSLILILLMLNYLLAFVPPASPLAPSSIPGLYQFTCVLVFCFVKSKYDTIRLGAFAHV